MGRRRLAPLDGRIMINTTTHPVSASRVQRSRRALAALSALLATALLLMVSVSALATGVLPDTIAQSGTFTDAGIGTTMGLAFDGTHYWAVAGGSGSGQRLVEYDAAGTLVAKFSPGLDFRSVFTDATNTVFARAYSDPKIYKMTSPGVFATQTTLTGGSLDSQSSVVLNSAGTAYIAQNGGTVTSWDLTGALIGSTTLVGFGTPASENGYPSGRGVAAFNGNWLTYDTGTAMLSEWNSATGARLGKATLTGAGTGFDSAFSFSYARGAVWVIDNAGGAWRAFALASSSTAVSCNPSPVALNSATTCTATVTDTSTGAKSSPAGTVTFTGTGGAFTGSPCTLASASASSSSCSVTFTPSTTGTRAINAAYSGSSHGASNGTTNLSVRLRTTTTSVSCSPTTVTGSGSTTCTATVADGDTAPRNGPSGTVTFSSGFAGASFSPASCALVAVASTTTASCSSTFSSSAAGGASQTVSAAYGGDNSHAASSGTAAVAFNPAAVTPTLPKAGLSGDDPGMPAAILVALALLVAGVVAGGALAVARRS